ncbi:MAG: hypothetical protein EPO13_04765 [Actinomycetota bacterium]|nr:MAG: hypothetical protein EPO13_04765 [Actinomycetota bacterium]
MQIDTNATLRIAHSNNAAANFDPPNDAGFNGDFQFHTMVYDRLLQVDVKNAVQPMLATEYKFDAAGTTLTLTLRTGVKFTDGTPFNAAAVVANLQRAQKTGTVTATALSKLSSIEASGDSTVILKLTKAEPAFIYTLTSTAGFMISPAAFADSAKLAKTPVGTGPYTLTSADTALTYDFTRNPGYWDTSQQFPAKARNQLILSEQARLSALQTNAVDQTSLSAVTADQAKNSGLQVSTVQSISPLALLLNDKLAPLDNPDVRRAISIGIDRNAVNAGLNGHCQPLQQPFPEGISGHTKDSINYNVTEAKRLISTAGANGATIKLLSINLEPHATITDILQAQLTALGFNVVQTKIEANLGRRTFSEGGYHAFLIGTTATAPDPTAYLDGFAFGAANPGTKNYPELLALVNTARVQPLGSAARDTEFGKVTTYLLDKPVWVPVCAPEHTYVGSKNLVGLTSMSYTNVQTSGADPSHLQIKVGS